MTTPFSMTPAFSHLFTGVVTDGKTNGALGEDALCAFQLQLQLEWVELCGSTCQLADGSFGDGDDLMACVHAGRRPGLADAPLCDGYTCRL